MARLLLIRHAPTPETGKKLTGRLSGVDLDEEGRASAAATARNLSDLRIGAIYSSPIERTWQTAEIIAAEHRIEPRREDGLIEVDYGRWSGRSLKSLYKLKAWRTVQMTPSRMVFPEGEGIAQAQSRAVESCERLAAAHPRSTVALVSHSDIIKAILSHYLGQPLDLFQRIAVDPASVSVLDLPRQGFPRVIAINSSGSSGGWR